MVALMSSSPRAESDAMEAFMPVPEPHDDDFVVLTGSHVISPSRQLTIKFGRVDLEVNGVQQVGLYFDRALKPDRLMMPASESPYYITPSDPTADVPLIPFISEQQRKLFEFGFVSRVVGTTLVFLLNYDEESAYLMLRELARQPKHVSHDRPAELMGLILRGIARLRDWPVLELSHGASIDSVELRLSHRFVAAIERQTELGLEACDTGEDLLAAWEVGR